MKTLVLVMIFILVYQNGLCQEKQLIIVNSVSNKEIAIKENRRIKVITKTGEKFAGRFAVLNQNSIVVDWVIISLNEIDIIRKHPLLHTVMMNINFLHIGSITFFIALAIGNVPFVFIGAAALTGGIYGVVKSPNILKGYKTLKDWTYSIEPIKSP